MTSSVAGPRRSFKALPEAQLAPKKWSWSLLSDGPLSVWLTFWIPAKSLHLGRMLSKSVRQTQNCKACSQHWSTERAQFFSTAMPDHMPHTSVEWIELWNLPLSPYSPDLSPTDYHLFKLLENFLQGKYFHNQQDAENAFQVFIESWNMDFYATGINLFFLGKKCVDCNGSYFD